MNRATRSRVRAATILACAATLGGCASLERDEVAAPQGGGIVTMRSGTPLVVSLPADPTTGNGWVLQSGSPNLALIGGADHTPAPKPPGLVGVADTTVFRFRAQAPGDAALVFAWTAPPGASPAPAPERTVRYDVKIDPPPLNVGDVFATGGSGKKGQAPVRYWFF